MRQLAVGLCVRPADGALLLEHGEDRTTGARFYRAIGGGCEPDEQTDDAVVREWQEEFALAVRVVRMLGALDNRFVYEGRPGHEHVSVFEVVPDDARTYAAAQLTGRDPMGQSHVATWVTPDVLRAPESPPVYPAGVLQLLRAAG